MIQPPALTSATPAVDTAVLAPALALYRSLGFAEVPLPRTDYRRANIKMVLELSRPDGAKNR